MYNIYVPTQFIIFVGTNHVFTCFYVIFAYATLWLKINIHLNYTLLFIMFGCDFLYTFPMLIIFIFVDYPNTFLFFVLEIRFTVERHQMIICLNFCLRNMPQKILKC